MWKAVAAAAILDLVPACVRAAPEPSVPAMPSLSYMRPEEFHSSVLIFWRDLLAEQRLFLRQLFYSSLGKRLAGSS